MAKGALANVLKLLLIEVILIFVAHVAIKQLFGFDIFDFQSRMGQIIGVTITAFVMYSIYSAVGTNEINKLGAEALYEKGDSRRIEAQQSIQPLLAASMV